LLGEGVFLCDCLRAWAAGRALAFYLIFLFSPICQILFARRFWLGDTRFFFASSAWAVTLALQSVLGSVLVRAGRLPAAQP
jgi:hypothetical protein